MIHRPAVQSRLLPIAAIIVLCLAAYAPVMSNGYIWDDASWVTHARYDQGPAILIQFWTNPQATPQYYPLTSTFIWLEHRLWGDSALGFHLMSVALYAAMVSLLYLAIRRLRVPGALAIALIWAVHPIFVESVAWATEQKNTLSGLFAAGLLLATLCFYRIGDTPKHASDTATNEASTDNASEDAAESAPEEKGHQTSPAWLWYAVMWVLYVAAVLSKTVTVTVPAAALLLVWWHRRRITLRNTWPMLPLLAVGAMLAQTTATLEQVKVGALGQDWDFSFIERCLIAGRAAWFYVGKIIWPHPLAFFYPRWTIDTSAWWQYVFPVAATVVVIGLIVLAWRRRLGWGPAVAVLIYGGTLLPASGFFDVFPMRFSFVADHFAFLPSLTMIALLVGSVVWLARRWQVKRGRRMASPTVAVVALAVLVAALRQEFRPLLCLS